MWLLRYSFVAIISGLHGYAMLLSYNVDATVGGLLWQLLDMVGQMLIVTFICGLLLDNCGCFARCGCLDVMLMLITVSCLDI